MRQLEEEEPELHIVWDDISGQVLVQLMGEIQTEILQQMIHERFGLEVKFGTGQIVYKETIARAVEGVGHFEPLRHYAEVHLLLSPAERGSGTQFTSTCSEDVLDKNWQRLIATHVEEKEHRGVLTGSALDRCEGHYSYRKSTCKAHGREAISARLHTEQSARGLNPQRACCWSHTTALSYRCRWSMSAVQ